MSDDRPLKAEFARLTDRRLQRMDLAGLRKEVDRISAAEDLVRAAEPSEWRDRELASLDRMFAATSEEIDRRTGWETPTERT